ncbi:Chemotaxis phosphatase CheX [Formivibrio citricus]|uniref:Chemotaxis phosphatase CheX n=1 Tax=Formivibrio citricus TaxID=83765 RepID=A0A1I4VUZ1_9NEIS|nr:chemotaxis protein CheX [Formivibrio citricus]SFN05091.1 Chemotaxis phosphatase CheX [Formivibrio citricus]
MNSNKMVVSKVLVLDGAGLPPDSLKAFCEECGLVAIKPQQGDADSVMTILKSNVDLGGILLHENYGGKTGQGLELARAIHASRPELPLFLRRDAVSSVAGLAEQDAAMFRCAYTLADLQLLKATLEASIFSRVYPNDLVRGITEITRGALQPLFRECDIDVETPYLVKDRIIYGEVFTMMAIDSHWCRGYMMLQAAEEAMMALISREAGIDEGETMTFRELNNVLGEATNLAWGAFKSRYVSQDVNRCQCQTQVPIIINHQRRYISFGSEDPQLCIKYTLRERNRPDVAPVPLFQRFVFNLNWSPDEFRENPTVESLVESGELELF